MLKSKGYYQENYVFLVFWKIFMETLKNIMPLLSQGRPL